MKRSAIIGAGHFVPPKVVTNDDLGKLMPTNDEWIRQRTGIEERRFAEEGVTSSDLAVPACKLAVERAGREVKDIDAIIFATLSPDVEFPGNGCFLQHKLGLPGIPALDVRNQCSGFLYSLSVADAWVRTGQHKNVLVVGAEVHSTGIELNERGRDVAVLFGDGAGAVLVGESPDASDSLLGRGILTIRLHADGSGAEDLWIEAPSSRYQPRINHQMLDEGRQWPKMKGKQVFRWAVEKMPEVAKEVLEATGLTVDDIDLFVPHQANMRINQWVSNALGIPEAKVVHNIQRYGNTTAATIPIGLSESWEDGRLKDATVLMAAFGSGYTWAGAVARF